MAREKKVKESPAPNEEKGKASARKLFSSLSKSVGKSLESMEKSLMAATLNIENQALRNDTCLRDVYQTVRAHEKVLQEIKNTNLMVEESLNNVLIAIRQNEYLQAWYPPSEGQPEMKVIGIHPSKTVKVK